tara:strand:+ start:4745 stop:4969 length:225 start_codon:yes stop_codon:yes gene_type:complete
MKDIVAINKKILREKGKEFKRIFGVDIRHFLNPIFGFDIVSFGVYLQVPDYTSVKDFIRDRYNQNAVELIMECL